MIRRPPRSTPFPTRRSSDLSYGEYFWTMPLSQILQSMRLNAPLNLRYTNPVSALDATSTRSEEHTSELQSRQYLVCRLLLEKKKKIKTDITTHMTSTMAASV